MPGEHENHFEVRIIDSSGNDKTFNYNIIYDYGTVTINKRDLNLKTSSAYFTIVKVKNSQLILMKLLMD